MVNHDMNSTTNWQHATLIKAKQMLLYNYKQMYIKYTWIEII